MATVYDYENYKRYLQGLNLTPAEYDKKLREWCKKHKF
jgi:hypothetical protein